MDRVFYEEHDTSSFVLPSNQALNGLLFKEKFCHL